MERFQGSWSSWATKTEAAATESFRVCFRLEPPELDTRPSEASRETWILRYFLQAVADPSLLISADQVWREGGEVHLELEANAFLPQQVRRTASAVLRVGLGKLTVAAFEALADSPVRGAAEHVLPAAALCLQRVTYTDLPPRKAAQNEMVAGGHAVI